MNSRWLAGVVGFQLAIAFLPATCLPEGSRLGEAAGEAVFLTQTLLLGLWLALGWERHGDKMACIAVAGAVMAFPYSREFRGFITYARTDGEGVLLTVAVGAVCYVLGAAAGSAPILVARAHGWQVEVTPVAVDAAARPQFTLARLLAWTAAAALALGVGRAAAPFVPAEPWFCTVVFLPWLYVTCLVALQQAPCLPPSWQVFTLVLIAGVVGWGQATRWDHVQLGQMAATFGMACSAAVPVLWAIRASGYRLAWRPAVGLGTQLDVAPVEDPRAIAAAMAQAHILTRTVSEEVAADVLPH